MSKKSGYLLGMLFTIITCMILAWLFCCESQTETTRISTQTPIEETSDKSNAFTRDNSKTFISSSNENFTFHISPLSIPKSLPRQVNQKIGKLHVYLTADDNTEKLVAITRYSDG